jgi:3-hydroxyisobutyrate dehydrogenase
MGYPMAGFLSKAGHEVVVYNRTDSKADSWTRQYGRA